VRADGENGGLNGHVSSGEGHALRVLVSGRVQGVFFRAFTQEEARRLGVRGWVRNLSDGRVEAHIEHKDRGVLDAMLARLREGPPQVESMSPGARVDEVEAWAAKWEGFGDFEIRGGW
jgi:acylphosphatase